MEKVLNELRLKADRCGDSTKENRARKGAYIDCIVMIKEELKNSECPYCKRTEPCKGSYPEGCFHPDEK